MEPQELSFYSRGQKLAGLLYNPAGNGPHPLVVMAGGWCYVKELAQPEYAKEFAKSGVAALIFDYANFGESEGEPRQHIDPWQQIENYRDAISFAETLPAIDANRIGVWGISYSGGHALILAGIDSRVKAAISHLPVVNGRNAMRLTHGAIRYRDLTKLIADDRRSRAKSGEFGYLPMSSATPHTELSTWPLPEVAPPFEQWRTTTAPRHQHRSTIASVDLLIGYDVEPHVRRIVNTPTLVSVAEGDDITQWDEEQAMFNLIPTPEKRLVVLSGTSHMKLYSDLSRLQIAAIEHRRWLVEHLIERFGI